MQEEPSRSDMHPSIHDLYTSMTSIKQPLPFEYVGCLIFAVTSIVVLCFYFYKTGNTSQTTTDDVVQELSEHMVLELACKMAKSEDSFLQYLKDLDGNSHTFPAHCRTIDFFLACRMPEPLDRGNEIDEVDERGEGIDENTVDDIRLQNEIQLDTM